MKRLVILTTLLLTACGPSPKEKQEIAIITCNIVEAQAFQDGASIIKEVNKARGEIGGSKFIGAWEEFVEASKYDLCVPFILEDRYAERLKKAVSDRQKAELERLEKERIAEEKRLEEERLSKQNAIKQSIENTKLWVRNNAEFIANRQLPRIAKSKYRHGQQQYPEDVVIESEGLLSTAPNVQIKIRLDCQGMDNFKVRVDYELINGTTGYQLDWMTTCHHRWGGHTIRLYFDSHTNEAKFIRSWIEENYPTSGKGIGIFARIDFSIFGISPGKEGFDDPEMKAREDLLYIRQPKICGEKTPWYGTCLTSTELVFKETIERRFPDFSYLADEAMANPFKYNLYLKD